jgi:monofunctional biosynthetic peptidoglycan transglycosylase
MTKRPFAIRFIQYLGWLIASFVLISVVAVLVLRWVDPPTSAFMIADRIGARVEGPSYRLRHRWTDWDRIAGSMKVAVIASEDQTFPVHRGFDFKSIDKALEERDRGRRVRGASTISQQVAKNLFLWSGRSWIRKGLEAYFTLLIETLWPKQRILEVYLNVAQFGRGIYGVGAASDVFFRKSPARLNASDAALLAAVLPNPIRLRVNAPSRYVRSRQQWILGQMRGLGGTSFLRRLE